MIVNEDILMEIIENLDHYKEVIEPIKTQRNYSLNTITLLFHNDIIDNYETNIRKLIIQELGAQLKWNTEDIKIALCDIDLVKLLE